MAQNSPMKPLHPNITALLVLVVSLLVVALPGWQAWQAQKVPDFAGIPAGEARKEAFFDYLGPMIDAENRRRLDRRAKLEGLRDRAPGKREQLWLEDLAAFFDVPPDLPHEQLIEALLEHVDIVPRSLALAQAAKESAWGTSRFAVEGHNYFGQRCYSKGCGLVPKARSAGARFEVRSFPSVRASVISYMHNINSHPEYAGLREYRAKARQAGEPVRGILAAEQLSQYSERRQEYVDEIQSLIHFNRLASSVASSETDDGGDSSEAPFR